jgi:transcriptional regulator with PAS, ATPase and Fis domain
MQLSSLSRPDSDASCPDRNIPVSGTNERYIVHVWDYLRPRLKRICDAIYECGFQPHLIEQPSAVAQVGQGSRNVIATIALGKQRPGAASLALDLIHAVKRIHGKVISYENGLRDWQLSQRCLALTAGSTWLLDSAEERFEEQLRRLLAQLVQEETRRQCEDEQVKGKMRALEIIGNSSAMMSIFRQICRVSTLSDIPILVMGETGTGKELVARAIHQLDSKRCTGPFVPINCGALASGLMESELFGHRRGAFTGAISDRRGLIRSAQEGVLFLDEISEMDLALQAKLLRVLQENRVLGVGEEHETAVNVRVIAASNRDLEEMVRQGRFRVDLFHRLNVLSVSIPPLRDRPDDLKPLIKFFLARHSYLQPHQPYEVRADFIEALSRARLPGNVRELENLIRQILINRRHHNPLDLSDLPEQILGQLVDRDLDALNLPKGTQQRIEVAGEPDPSRLDFVFDLLEANNWRLPQALGNCERSILEIALHRTKGNQSAMARLLGITPRTVYNKLLKHGLNQ